MGNIILVNDLPLTFVAREAIERAVRAAFAAFPGGPWSVLVRKQARDPQRVTIQGSLPGSTTCTSFMADSTVGDIAAALSVFMLSRA